MIALYKKYHTLYWIFGIVFIIIAVIWALVFPDNAWMGLLIILPLVLIDVVVFSNLAKTKFINEVMIYFHECRINEFMTRLEALMGNRKEKGLKSCYSYLVSMGYAALGDYDKSYEMAQGIKVRNHMPEYYKRVADYYINQSRFDKADEMLDKLKISAGKQINSAYKKTLMNFIGLREHEIRVKKGDLSGAEEFYLGFLTGGDPLYLITRVSISWALGNVLALKGDNERAKAYLMFASEHGKDSKYKKLADDKITEIKLFG